MLSGNNPAKYFKGIVLLFFAATLFASFHVNVSAADSGAVQSYADVYKNWQNSKIQDAEPFNLEIPAANFVSKSSDADIQIGAIEEESDIMLWNNDIGEVEYSFQVPTDGLYGISVEYYSINKIQQPVERGIKVNGELPFLESGNFLFEKKFVKGQAQFQFNAEGNHIHPGFKEVKSWSKMTLSDRNGSYEEPFRFFFRQGENKLTLTGLNGSIAVSKIVIHSPEEIESYETYRSSLPDGNDELEFFDLLEAEDSDAQSGPNIQLQSNAEPGVTPQVAGKRIFNTIGGDNWANAHDWIEWKFNVPRDGRYQIAFKYKQNTNTDLNVYRKIEIDGSVPFKELSSVSFPFGASWQSKVLGDEQPYEIYLAEGEHTIRLTVTNEPYRDIRKQLAEIVSELRELDLKIKDITGVENVDLYRRWNLNSYIPGLDTMLKRHSESIRELAEEVARLTGMKASSYGELMNAVKDLEELSQSVDEIPKRADSLSFIYTSMTDWSIKLDRQPLLLDQVMFKNENETFPSVKVGFFEKLMYFVKGFFASFSLNNDDSGKTDEDTIQIWVQRNKNYVSLMQEYANNYFTPETGIKINVNYAPPGSNLLVLANAAGKQPDLAAGVDSFTNYSFAERGALVNLNQFPEYDELKKQVVPGALVPYRMEDGDYGFPEEVIYNVLYYREDIMNSLNLDIPQTWDDVVKDIPTLVEHNFDFFYPYGDFQTFFAQNNVDLYSEDGSKVAFATPEGFNAFQFWTDLYVKYGMPEQMANFYQHFRLGDAPVGITGIDQYVMFKLSAPDISGLWNIALAPGTENKDGTIQRWEAGVQNGIMMFKTNKERQDRAWKFMRWWVSTETQTNFANDLNNYYGPEFMWYSPNLQVIEQQIAWNREVKEILAEQLQWYKPVPFVHGGSYMTPRTLWNAWTATVIDKKNFRQQFEMAAREIQTEMEVKQREFGTRVWPERNE